eukprot:gnl/MRDRNA2_/MRDRNA2_87277_c0_seq1.p1 gnl/MRDRNA2_/MRDRNA2_87277_c0~~gnl/MRDRNA2_/MRDRNA2_87277_c0_seq1.p1  ORF type:complete len:251 (-),score=36.95 gnl/MRDRNA2_/MRDRNA2_87277_c0_seq1:190-942(-)
MRPSSRNSKMRQSRLGGSSSTPSLLGASMRSGSRYGHQAQWRETPAVPKASANLSGFFKQCARDLDSMRQEIQEEEEAFAAQGIRTRNPLRGMRRTRTDNFSFGDSRPSSRPGSRGTSCPFSPPQMSNAEKAFLAQQLAEGADAYRREWERHDEAWASFQAKPPNPLLPSNVPWPPCNTDVLEFTEKLWAPGSPKRAYRVACRRWHPDKFLQRFGELVPQTEIESVTSRVNEVFQAVTAQWETMQRRLSA